MATHSSILAQEVPSGLQSMRSKSIRHDLATKQTTTTMLLQGFPGVSVINNSPPSVGAAGDVDSIPGSGRFLEQEMASLSSILTQEIAHGQRNLTGQSSWDHRELDTTEHAQILLQLLLMLRQHLYLWVFQPNTLNYMLLRGLVVQPKTKLPMFIRIVDMLLEYCRNHVGFLLPMEMKLKLALMTQAIIAKGIKRSSSTPQYKKRAFTVSIFLTGSKTVQSMPCET